MGFRRISEPSTVFWDLFEEILTESCKHVSFGHGSIQNDWGKNLCAEVPGVVILVFPETVWSQKKNNEILGCFPTQKLPGSFGHHAGDGCQSAWDPGQSNKKITARSGPFVGCLRVMLQQRHQVWHIGIMLIQPFSSIYDISWIYPPGWQWQTKVSIL